MTKKVLSIIGLSFSGLVLLFYLISTFLAAGSDWKILLVLLAFSLPFMLLGIPAILLMNTRRIISIIFLILSGIATSFLGLMCLGGGLPFLGIIGLPLCFIMIILYIISIILILLKK